MHRGLACCALIALVNAGCGGDDSGTGGAGTTGPGSGGAGGGGPSEIKCDGAPAELALAGTWAAKARLAVDLQGTPGGAITLCPSPQTGEASMLLMVTVEQPGPSELANVRAALCALELPIVTAKVGDCAPGDTNVVQTQLIAPEALVAALPNVPSMPATGNVEGTDKGAAFDLTGLRVTVGSTKPGDQMPSWDADNVACEDTALGNTNQCEMMCVSDCAALRDDDNDGYPGVTIHVCGYTEGEEPSSCHPEDPATPGVAVQGRGFAGIEVSPALTGTAVSSCELKGKVSTPIDYAVIGADVYLGGAAIGVSSVIKSLPTFEVDGEASSFRMIRIDGEYGAPGYGADASDVSKVCAAIIANQNDI